MDLVVVSTWCPFPPTNGSKLRAFNLLKGLARHHRVHLLTFAEAGEDAPAMRAALGEFCASVEVVAGNPAKAPARLSLSGLFSNTPRAYLQGFNPAMQSLVDARIGSCQAAMALTLPASLYLRGTKIPCLLEEVEVTSIVQQRELATGLARWRRELTIRKLAGFVRRLSREMQLLTTVSAQEREAILAMGCAPERVFVVPNGADADDLTHPRPASDGTRLVYSGSVTYAPNLDAVRWFSTVIWPIVRAQCPEAQFTVTGSTAGVDVSDCAAVPGVTFTGFVPDVKAVVAGASACVVPLRFGGGTRLKVLEAMALGTPVVATSKAVEGLDVVDGTHVIIADTPDAFAAAVVQVCADESLAHRLQANGRRLIAETYAWPRIADTLSEQLVRITS